MQREKRTSEPQRSKPAGANAITALASAIGNLGGARNVLDSVREGRIDVGPVDAFASDFVSDSLRASGIGWYSTTVGLLQLVASLVAGILWDRIGHPAVFYYGAVFALLGMIGLVTLIPDTRQVPST